MPRARLLLGTAAVLLLSSTPTRTADQILIAPGSAWRYNDSGTNLGTAWTSPSYVDTSWPSGNAQLGYGDGDETTVISYGSSTTNRRITYYFRRSFAVTDPSTVGALSLRFLRDDGCVIYLNGVEVARSNMPSGAITYTTLAPVAIGGADESAWLEAPIDPSRLVAGNNVLAVEVHQQSATSTDVSFDLELRATENRPPLPAVSLTSPAHLSIVNTAAVTFEASVSAPAGLVSATLYAGGPPQTVTFTGPAQIQDAQITADSPTVPNGAATAINVDGLTPHAHALMKFPTLIGTGAGRLPAGAVVSSATLQVTCTNFGNPMRLYRLTQDWVEDQATWTQRATGIAWGAAGADGAASNAGVALVGDCTTTGQRLFDLTRFVQEWSNGAPNYGIVLVDSGSDGVDFSTSESTSPPVLTVVYKPSQTPLVTQALSGAAADVTFSGDLPLGQTYFWNVLVTDAAGQQSWAPTDFELTLDAHAPNEPVPVYPADGASNVDRATSLQTRVSDPDGGPLRVDIELRRAAQPEFTIIALPDTQHYSEAYPAIFTSQTQWIVDNRDTRNIVFVTHEGDIVQNYGNTTEWVRANQSMSLLDGVVPYGMGPGNHDQPTTLFNQYFPFTRYQSEPWYGGHYQTLNDNNYQLFSGGGIDFVIVHLQFCPPAGAVTWADSIFKMYPERIGIMTTHGYLNEAAQRTVHSCTNTQYLWDGLAVPNPNLHFMLSGHVHDESRRADVANGHPVYQMLADYQDRASGGEGWLRILRFVPAENTVYVQTYSPWLNRFETDANSEFTLDFPMAGAFTTISTTNADSGATVFATPPHQLEPDTAYEWKVTVTNSSGRSRTGPVWRFTTAFDGTINRAPVAQSQNVSAEEDGSVSITLGASDPEGNPLTYSIVSDPTHGTLSGTPPAVVYMPSANYNGADSFSFRANDGNLSSNVATITVAVQAMNDPPVAAPESYVVQAGSTLAVTAPGVLANDSDIENASLTAGIVSGPAHGSLSLSTNGSFSYTPAAGYSGGDSFSYRASDGTATSAATTVSITVQAAPPAPTVIVTANFNSSENGFSYRDNTFRGTSQGSYASGSRVSSGGFTGGALRVRLGGENSNTINGMSGGWRRTFTLSAPATVTLSFRYSLDQGPDYESDEYSQVLASINGVLTGTPPADHVAQVVGNGNGGSSVATGWRLFEKSLGTLPAGTHTVILGGYNNKKNSSSERTTILIDDVAITR
jgi:VCBS repeat-containing protein